MCNSCNAKNETSAAECGCSEKLIAMARHIHTQNMVAVGQDKNFPEIEPKRHYEIVANKTRVLLAEAGYLNLQLPSFETEVEIISEIQNTKPEDYIALLVERGTITKPGEAFLQRIWSILDSNVALKFKLNRLSELQDFLKGVQTLPKKEYTALLYGLEIAKASLRFFQEVSKDKDSPYYRVIRSNNARYRPFPWADCIGGVVNCLGCAEGAFVGCLGCASISSSLASSWFASEK